MTHSCLEQPAYGLTMDRSDARTQSQTLVEMDPKVIRFSYRQRDPDGSGFLDPVIIEEPISQGSVDG